MSDQPAPIIIKRKKVIAAGHHGGAWKVAYADFVTAMMAFFLLMWLLGATTEKQRKGIADYFNPTIPVNKVSGGGEGAFGGDSVFSENTLAKNGTGAGLTIGSSTEVTEGETETDPDSEDQGEGTKPEKDELVDVAEALSGTNGESAISTLLQRHVVTKLTDEGLIVEIFDIPDAPLFLKDGQPSLALSDVIAAIAEVFRVASNNIAVHGHVASVPLAARENMVWENSAMRANTVRRLLMEEGLSADRMQRVTGFADRKPVSKDKLAIRNNRIEVILLRSKL